MAQGTCDVCGQYKDVAYCPRCDAWMCNGCRANPVARAMAAGRRVLGDILDRFAPVRR